MNGSMFTKWTLSSLPGSAISLKSFLRRREDPSYFSVQKSDPTKFGGKPCSADLRFAQVCGFERNEPAGLNGKAADPGETGLRYKMIPDPASPGGHQGQG